MSIIDAIEEARRAAEPLSGDALLDAYNAAQRTRGAAADAVRAADKALAAANASLANAELLASQLGAIMRDRQS